MASAGSSAIFWAWSSSLYFSRSIAFYFAPPRGSHSVSVQILPQQRSHGAFQAPHVLLSALRCALHRSLHHFLLGSQLVAQPLDAFAPAVPLAKQRRGAAVHLRAGLVAPRQLAQQIRGEPGRIGDGARGAELLQLLLEFGDFLLQRRDAAEANFVHHRCVLDHLRVGGESQRRERLQRRRFRGRDRGDDGGEGVSAEGILQ